MYRQFTDLKFSVLSCKGQTWYIELCWYRMVICVISRGPMSHKLLAQVSEATSGVISAVLTMPSINCLLICIVMLILRQLSFLI
jgi:hypothetical protein